MLGEQQRNPQAAEGGQQQNQNQRRGLLGVLDNASFNFQGSQEIGLDQMHSFLQSQAIRDPAGARDFEQSMNNNRLFIEQALAQDREDNRRTTQAFLDAIDEFRTYVTRPLWGAIER